MGILRRRSSDENDDENGSVLDSSSSSSYSSELPPPSSDVESEEIALKESMALANLRILFVLLVLAGAAMCTGIVGWLTLKAEEDQLQLQFNSIANGLFNLVEEALIQSLGVIAVFGNSYTSFAQTTDTTFPFVTMDDFNERGTAVLKLTKMRSIVVHPRVQAGERTDWEDYVKNNTSALLPPSDLRKLQVTEAASRDELDFSSGFADQIFMTENGTILPDKSNGPWQPGWQGCPAIANPTWVNYNLLSDKVTAQYAEEVATSGNIFLAPVTLFKPGNSSAGLQVDTDVDYTGRPVSTVYMPVFDSFKSTRKTAALMVITIGWEHILPPTASSVMVVIGDGGCSPDYSFEIDESGARYLGQNVPHDPRFDLYERKIEVSDGLRIEDGTEDGLRLVQANCTLSFALYPTEEIFNEYHTDMPTVISIFILSTFLFAVCMFGKYDYIVAKRQQIVKTQADTTTAIVSDLFPVTVRKRLIESQFKKLSMIAPNYRLKSFLSDNSSVVIDDAPIADLFPATSVMFADLCEFTSWSSQREPAQVFVLLQGIYQAFDHLAKQFRVFKVETIGDCYVAVTGLPNPQEKHAILMVRFAAAAIKAMKEVTRRLEISLGPGTADLSIRIGIHSGPVTAGVLKGDKTRFQLFGDTVNTSARLESTSKRDQIQVSQSTAEELFKHGKQSWLTLRTDAVNAKGKGYLKTYWAEPKRFVNGSEDTSSNVDSASCQSVEPNPAQNQGEDRLVQWATEMLVSHVSKVVAHQKGVARAAQPRFFSLPKPLHVPPERTYSIPLDEVVKVIHLPKFNVEIVSTRSDNRSVELDESVVDQIYQLVSVIANSYRRENAFHNFEHACHVTMSVDKFLKRIVSPDLDFEQIDSSHDVKLASHLHDYTFGITSDPMTPLAIIFSALVHDVDHQGVSNSQLGKEEEHLATLYREKSLAEQKSLEIAWDMFLSSDNDELRSLLFPDKSELARFRQMLVNVVLATDIFDKEINEARTARWTEAFGESATIGDSDLRATIVIEHIIQASDVAHTMQHWHVYCKWNRRLFSEMRTAYEAGRMEVDPASFWYQGELNFFDFYVIPLAKKLKDCNVFGVSSDECLTYATQNRAEWKSKGKDIVSSMVEELGPAVASEIPARQNSESNDTATDHQPVFFL